MAIEHPLRAVCTAWLSKIRKAMELKDKQFGEDAKECMSFFHGPYDFLYKGKGALGRKDWHGAADVDTPGVIFGACVNKAAEMVQIFGPSLYFNNPARTVVPRRVPAIPIELFGNPQDPMAQMQWMGFQQQIETERNVDKARAGLLESYLNFTPGELDAVTHVGQAIDECIIKGMGVRWTELYTPKGSNLKIVGSFYDTIDNLVLDPDVEVIEDATWCARRCVHPVWQVEKEYGLKPGSLKGNLESFDAQADAASVKDGDWRRARGDTNDLMVYWKVYSKMGVGGRLSGMKKEFRESLDPYGDYSFLVVADGIPYPLNVPTDIISAVDDTEIKRRFSWPTPFWADDDWPFTPYSFHKVPRQLWPMSHLRPALGELRFLNWAYSFLMGKVKNTSRDFIAVAADVDEEFRNTILNGKDLSLLKIERSNEKTIKELVEFLQHPTLNPTMLDVIKMVEENFDKRTGLNELMYGSSSRQLRSAEEAQVKGNFVNVRPDHMAKKVEEAEASIAKKELIAARWHLEGVDVQPILGQVGAYFWDKLVITQDPVEIVHQFEANVVAGSTKRPNVDQKADATQNAMQTLFQPLMQYAMTTGMVDQVNALIASWGEANQIPDIEKMLLLPPPPPPMMPPGGGPEDGGGGPPGGAPQQQGPPA